MAKQVIKVPRSTLYFGQWQYVIQFHLSEASFLRRLNHAAIDESINYRNEWQSVRSWQGRIFPITQQKLHQACDYLLSRPHAYKKTVSSHCIWLYTNDLADFADIETKCDGQVLSINQAELCFAPDVVTLIDPKHAFRTYFKEGYLTEDQQEILQRYFATRADQFRPGPGLREFLRHRRVWMANNYFVDHNEPNADVLISMVMPGIVRKTLPIVARTK